MSSPIIPSNGPVNAFTTSASGGGNLNTNEAIYEPFAPPETANELDAEFVVDESPLTEFDLDNDMTYAIGKDGLTLSVSSYAGAAPIVGFLQALPNGFTNFSIESYNSQSVVDFVTDADVLSGIMLADGNDANAAIYTLSFITGATAGHSIATKNFTDYQTLSTTPYTRALSDDTNGLFLRIRKDADNYYFDYSLDGRGWLSVYQIAIASFPFTPTHFGIMMQYVGADGTTQNCKYSFLRYKDSDVGLDGSIGGRRVWGLGSVISGGAAPVAAGTIYNPFAAPPTPHTLDVEFVSGILPLTEFDLDDVLTYTVDARGAALTISSTPTDTSVTGLLQELPNGFSSFTIEGHAGQYVPEPVAGTYFLSGLILSNGISSNSKCYTWTLATGYNIEHSLYAHYFSDYHTLDSLPYVNPLIEIVDSLFLRIRKDNINYYFDYSLDGMGWLHVFSVGIASFPFIPTHFGVAIEYPYAAGIPKTSRFSFLRYKDSDVGINGFIGGRRVNYYT